MGAKVEELKGKAKEVAEKVEEAAEQAEAQLDDAVKAPPAEKKQSSG